jgi:hypothetical protein
MSLPRPLIDTLAQAPDQLARAFQQVAPADRRWAPESFEGIPGERFVAADQVLHVLDIEVLGYQVRFRRTLEEECPDLVSLDSYVLAEQREYSRRDPIDALRAFGQARAATLDMLGAVNAAQLARRATFGEYGHVSLLGLVHFLISHDQQHLACLQWLMGRMASRAS